MTPQTSRAQSAFGQPFPSSGYSAATIYVPSIPQTGGYLKDRNMMRADPFSPNVYPNRNSFPGLPGTPYYGSSYPHMRFVPSPPPKVVLPEQTFYGGKFYNNCTTRIIGNSILRPLPIDRYTGKPCF